MILKPSQLSVILLASNQPLDIISYLCSLQCFVLSSSTNRDLVIGFEGNLRSCCRIPAIVRENLDFAFLGPDADAAVGRSQVDAYPGLVRLLFYHLNK